jgi:DNA-binding NarL/FixJ family response regulator
LSAEHAQIRCLVADDHPAVLKAVCDHLEEAGMEVVARVRDGEEALAFIESLRPAAAVVDVRMPKLSGVEVAREAARIAPSTGIILFTGDADRALLAAAADAGARGFVLKERPLMDLVRAVEIVAAGGTYVDAVLAGSLAGPDATARLTGLTEREREVLGLLANGHSYDEIGKQLGISPETVRTHVRKAMGRLEAETRTQAVAKAIRQSLIL